MRLEFDMDIEKPENVLLRNVLCAPGTRRDLIDYMRTGDRDILRRVTFRLFIACPVPPLFTESKAIATMFMMLRDQTLDIRTRTAVTPNRSNAVNR